MQEADAVRKRLMRASSCVSANADARALPFMIMQRVCGNVDGPRGSDRQFSAAPPIWPSKSSQPQQTLGGP